MEVVDKWSWVRGDEYRHPTRLSRDTSTAAPSPRTQLAKVPFRVRPRKALRRGTSQRRTTRTAFRRGTSKLAGTLKTLISDSVSARKEPKGELPDSVSARNEQTRRDSKDTHLGQRFGEERANSPGLERHSSRTAFRRGTSKLAGTRKTLISDSVSARNEPKGGLPLISDSVCEPQRAKADYPYPFADAQVGPSARLTSSGTRRSKALAITSTTRSRVASSSSGGTSSTTSS